MRRQYKTVKGGGGGNDMRSTYFFVEDASGADNTLQIAKSNSSANSITFEYSYDQENWSEPIATSTTATAITIPANGRIYLRGVDGVWGSSSYYNAINASAIFDIGGNLFSLAYGEDFENHNEIDIQDAFTRLFYNSKNIRSAEQLYIPPITDVPQRCFDSCFSDSSIAKLPDGMFAQVVSAGQSAFSYCFYRCTSLTSLSDGMFAQVTSAGQSAFFNCFYGCSSLTSLSDGMFAQVVSADQTAFYSCFSGCSSLTSLSDGMFAQVTSMGMQSFSYCFSNCTSLTSLSDGIFAQVTSTGIQSFSNCFAGCFSLTSLSDGMFAQLVSAGQSAFSYCFYRCTSLTSLSDGMFAQVTSAGKTAFSNCFYDTSIEEGVDIRRVESVNTNSFQYTYYLCKKINVVYAPNITTWDESVFRDWLLNASSLGTFYKPKGLEIPTGASGIPEGWNVVEYE